MNFLKKYKTLLKWLLVLTALFVVCFYNREQIPLIAEQIRQTPKILLIISTLLALGYFICEGRIISLLGIRYQPSFTVWNGISAAFFCEFYRLLTLGSMTGVAEIYFLHTNKIPAAKGTGMCLVQYLIQRMTIAILGFVSCVIVLIQFPNLVQVHSWQIILSYLITILVLCGLIFIGTCKKTTTWLFCLIERKAGQKPKIKNLLYKTNEQVNILQSEVQILLQERRMMLRLLAQNIVKMICWFAIPAILLFNPENPAAFLPHMALTSMAFVLSGVIPSPGGIGSLEFVFILLFGEIMAGEQAASIIILFRLLISVVPFMIGALVAGFFHQEGEKISDFTGS